MHISVITPTYNRAYILGQCYESLCAQTDPNFEWVVVDDGSTDNTEALVQSFIAQKRISICYIRQENGGKHRAHNTAVQHATGELVVCLDSDDTLTENAVEVARAVWQEQSAPEITGILALRGDPEHRKPICAALPEGVVAATMFDLNNRYGFYGDTVLFFRTELLRRIPFATFEGERFIPETNLYVDIDRHGKMLLLDRVLYLCEYLPDGLTAKYHRLLVNNPNGTADTYYKCMCMATNLKTKLKYAVLTNIYRALSTNRNALHFEEGWLLLWLTALPSALIRQRFLRRFE